ncbi:STAS domain-containing protein [Nocardia takedensis]|uniref:STAS domain-containing protein n=1 Tax=Nocardia takedensis TaxID=259390 RepID=UPI000593BCDB|nr:STAS domain-containing protein [Nocardia takedensis]
MSEAQSPILTVEIEPRGSAVIVAVGGEVDMSSAPVLGARIAQAIRSDPALLVVDLSQVRFFGSAGLSLLAETSDLVAEGSLRVVAVGGPLRTIRLAALDQILDLFDTVEGALADPSA